MMETSVGGASKADRFNSWLADSHDPLICEKCKGMVVRLETVQTHSSLERDVDENGRLVIEEQEVVNTFYETSSFIGYECRTCLAIPPLHSTLRIEAALLRSGGKKSDVVLSDRIDARARLIESELRGHVTDSIVELVEWSVFVESGDVVYPVVYAESEAMAIETFKWAMGAANGESVVKFHVERVTHD